MCGECDVFVCVGGGGGGGGGGESIYSVPYIITYVIRGVCMYVTESTTKMQQELYFDLYCECCLCIYSTGKIH